MQLLTIALYSRDGRRQVLDFKPGALNVVTGESATGKSALLDILDYCTGRDTLQLPVGPITDTVSWYAALFQLGDTRAVVARPAPKSTGRSRQAMLKFGAQLDIPELTQLAVNTDTTTLRRHLGRRIGITESHRLPGDRRVDAETGAHLGHAMLLCLQGQSDIVSRYGLFHRQGEHFIAQAIKATLPYFLGAATFDQARKQTQLTAAKNRLADAEAEYHRAGRASDEAETTMAALWREAHTLGMVPAEAPPREAALEALFAAVTSPPDVQPGDRGFEQRFVNLQRECDQLRECLRELAADRQVLMEGSSAVDEFATSARIPRDRLASLNLLPLHEEGAEVVARDSGDSVCPLCRMAAPNPDPSVAALNRSLHQLSKQLDGVEATRPARHKALEEISRRTTELRQQLLAAEKALKALTANQGATAALPRQAQSDFVRGRIYGVLSTLRHADETGVSRLRRLRDTARATVGALEDELSPEQEYEALRARLVPIGRDIARWARELELEHGGTDIWLDADELTVTVGSDVSRIPMSRIGSAANWTGYHVVAHLALHRYFVLQNRPVPRILVLDQPTQAWYLPDSAGEASGDDTEAVERLFRLIHDIVRDLAPDLQVIVCDHVNLPAPWFQQAVVQNWRGGNKLIPQDWIDSDDQAEAL
ncbi:DUF3732 domain-containing protein [Streptomyces sp. NPDC001927]